MGTAAVLPGSWYWPYPYYGYFGYPHGIARILIITAGLAPLVVVINNARLALILHRYDDRSEVARETHRAVRQVECSGRVYEFVGLTSAGGGDEEVHRYCKLGCDRVRRGVEQRRCNNDWSAVALAAAVPKCRRRAHRMQMARVRGWLLPGNKTLLLGRLLRTVSLRLLRALPSISVLGLGLASPPVIGSVG